VTGGASEALRRAREAAGDLDVRVGGGAATLRQYLEAGLIDEMHFVVVPVLLGGGETLLGRSSSISTSYEIAEYESSVTVSHLLLRRRS
jgi:dihydrofolate reductase